SIYSSANDLSRFVVAMLNGGRVDGRQVLPPLVVSRLPAKHTVMPGEGPPAHYGYGLLSFEDRGVRMVMHGGFSRGYGSMIQMAPEHRFAVIVQTNRSGETLSQTRAKAAEMFLPFKPPAAESPKQSLPLSASEAANFAGTYRNGPQTWDIILKEGKLYYRQREGEHLLTRTGKHRLSFGEQLGGDLVFVADTAGHIKYIFDGLYSA
ncbi:MAG: serine hydrolase domain-containing protein, partial [Pyrinomonadaceae bacterium]